MRHLLAGILLLSGQALASLADEPTTSQLSDILTTSPQEGLKRVGDVFRTGDEKQNKATNHHLMRIYEASQRGGASNVFIVVATNMHDAVRASSSIFAGARSANTPAAVNQSHAALGSYWLVAYLGAAHTSPVRWIAERATVDGNKIRFSYRQPKAFMATKDIHPYYYWIPLGKLTPGTYEVELFDADENAVTLMRRVKVGTD